MTSLARTIREAQEQAAPLCAQCLYDAIGTEAESLGGLVDRLEAATVLRGTALGSDGEYNAAFSEVMSSLVLIAVLTMELASRPVLQVPEATLN
jgi:hypothetical protein